MLGTGTECVQRRAGACMSMWAMCRPLGCECGLWGYLGVNPWLQHPWLSTACGWLGWVSASRDSTQGLSRVHAAMQRSLAMVSAPPYRVARADLQAARGEVYMSVCAHVHAHVLHSQAKPSGAGLPCQHSFLRALFPVGLLLSCSLHRALCEAAAAEHKGISLWSRTCPCGLLLHSRAPAGDAEPPDVSRGNPPLQHCW